MEEPWIEIGWDLLDLTIIEFGPAQAWQRDLERFVHRSHEGHSVEQHLDVVGEKLALATQSTDFMPKQIVGVAWWLFAELVAFPDDLPGRDRAVDLALRWRASRRCR